MRRLLLTICLSLLLLGCNKAAPPPVRYPQTGIIFQVRDYGGIRGWSKAGDFIPAFTVWGDGRVVFPDQAGYVCEANLTRSDLDRLMTAAAALLPLESVYDQEPIATDTGESEYTVVTAEQRKTVKVIGMEGRFVDNEPHHSAMEMVRNVRQQALALLPAHAPLLRPRAVEIKTLNWPLDYPAATETWPAQLTGRLTGPAAEQAVTLVGLGPGHPFLVDGRTMLVVVAPLIFEESEP